MTGQHGAALVEQVILAVEADASGKLLQYADHDYAGFGSWVKTPRRPMPEALLANATFPSGRPLPPSLRHWLAFDTAMLREYGWLGSGYRFRAHTSGEHPVLALDIDDEPFAALMYPGFDVFLADNAGLVTARSDSAQSDATWSDTAQSDEEYSALAEDPRFAARMATHAAQCFSGSLSEDCSGVRVARLHVKGKRRSDGKRCAHSNRSSSVFRP